MQRILGYLITFSWNTVKFILFFMFYILSFRLPDKGIVGNWYDINYFVTKKDNITITKATIIDNELPTRVNKNGAVEV